MSLAIDSGKTCSSTGRGERTISGRLTAGTRRFQRWIRCRLCLIDRTCVDTSVDSTHSSERAQWHGRTCAPMISAPIGSQMRMRKCDPYGCGFGAGGGRSRAGQRDSKPTRLCDPSQKGLFSDWPQRQRPIAVRPARPNSLPSESCTVNSPSTRIDPLLKMITFAATIYLNPSRTAQL
jgi:hypothetical protein